MGVGNVSSPRREAWDKSVADLDNVQIDAEELRDDAVVRNSHADDAVQDSDDGATDGESYADAQMMASLLKAKVNSSGDGASTGPLLSDPRFADFNKALEA